MINIASSAKDTINIIGCEFNGTSNVEKHIIQIASKTAVVTIQDCDFNALGTSPNIIRFNDGLFKQGEVFVEMSDETIETLKSNFKFINNRIASDISVDKYVDTDDSDTKEVSKNSAIKLDEEITKIMK